jgi:hypothetical protein
MDHSDYAADPCLAIGLWGAIALGKDATGDFHEWMKIKTSAFCVGKLNFKPPG